MTPVWALDSGHVEVSDPEPDSMFFFWYCYLSLGRGCSLGEDLRKEILDSRTPQGAFPTVLSGTERGPCTQSGSGKQGSKLIVPAASLLECVLKQWVCISEPFSES